MMRSLGCLGLLMAFALVGSLTASQAIGMGSLVGLYAVLISKAGFEQVVADPTFGKVVALERAVGADGQVTETAEIAFELKGKAAHRAKLTRRPAAYDDKWYVGQPMPILVSRFDPSRISYDTAWHLRPEGQKRLAPLWDIAKSSSERRPQ